MATSEVLRKKIQKALGQAGKSKKAGKSAAFCVSGTAPAVDPVLSIDGGRPVSLPLESAPARKFRTVFEPAAYGKGTKTLVDTDVRRVLRLTPDRFVLKNPEWKGLMASILDQVQAALGLEDQTVEAHLYDLLFYDKGSFFKPHQDGERLDRMVATLVVGLPSSHTGGELVVRHEGKQEVIDVHSTSRGTAFAAFYADCEHEVRPVRSGRRLCLVYNLTVGDAKDAAPTPVGRKSAGAKRASSGGSKTGSKAGAKAGGKAAALQPLLEEWTKSAEKLVVPLSHEYTKSGLSWQTLKGADRTAAKALAEAAEQAGFHAYLTLVELHEAGSCEDDYDYRRSSRRGYGRWYDEEDDDYQDEDETEIGEREMGEIYDSDLELSVLVAPDGTKLKPGSIDLDDDECLDPDMLRAVIDREEFEGYTGNAGMTLDRWYHCAAILLWPAARHHEVLCGRHSPSAVPLLDDATKKWKKASKAKAPSMKAECVALAAAVISKWPEVKQGGYHWEARDEERESQSPSAALFAALAELDDLTLLSRFLAETLPRDVSARPGKALSEVCARHGWATFLPALGRLFAATTEQSLRRDLTLLESICAAGCPEHDRAAWSDACRQFGKKALAAFLKIDVAKAQASWNRQSHNAAGAVPALVRAFVAADQDGLLSDLFAGLKAEPRFYPVDPFQIETLIGLTKWLTKHATRPLPALERWVADCRTALGSLTVQEPPPPADFRRPAELKCHCEHCRALKYFLEHPTESTHTFRLREDLRSHLKSEIDRSKCDVDCSIDRSRSPHGLACVKNDKSWKASVKKYQDDLKRLEQVRELEEKLPRGSSE